MVFRLQTGNSYNQRTTESTRNNIDDDDVTKRLIIPSSDWVSSLMADRSTLMRRLTTEVDIDVRRQLLGGTSDDRLAYYSQCERSRQYQLVVMFLIQSHHHQQQQQQREQCRRSLLRVLRSTHLIARRLQRSSSTVCHVCGLESNSPDAAAWPIRTHWDPMVLYILASWVVSVLAKPHLADYNTTQPVQAVGRRASARGQPVSTLGPRSSHRRRITRLNMHAASLDEQLGVWSRARTACCCIWWQTDGCCIVGLSRQSSRQQQDITTCCLILLLVTVSRVPVGCLGDVLGGKVPFWGFDMNCLDVWSV